MTVSVQLPPGIAGEDVSVNVLQGGCSFEMKIVLPDVLYYSSILSAPWIERAGESSYNKNHPEVLALEKELKDLRQSLKQPHSDPIG